MYIVLVNSDLRFCTCNSKVAKEKSEKYNCPVIEILKGGKTQCVRI